MNFNPLIYLSRGSKAKVAAKRPELEQAFIRLVLGSLLIAYYTHSTWNDPERALRGWLVPDLVMAAWLIVSIAVSVAVVYGKPYSRTRRLIAITADLANTTYFFHAAPQITAPLYCLYLWYVVGNGFRFGVGYLYYTLGGSWLGFTSAVLLQPYWQDKTSLGIGLSVGMIAISLYFSTLAKRLQSALETAEAANLAKRQFVSSVSHEMRTPLNAIIGMTDLLRSSPLNREQVDMVRSLDSGSRLLLSLVNDVLDFSKIEAGKMTIESAPFNLYSLTEETVRLFKYHAAEKGLVLDVEVHHDVPVNIVGDATHLRQVITNFLSNAIKFTEQGRVVLRIAALSVKDNYAHLLFEVEDTGIGISTTAKAFIFESFTQADASTTRRFGGTGLGTTIAKQLVELMGGRIGFRSDLGAGSTFWCELQFSLVPQESPSAAPLSELSPTSAPAVTKPRRILVAEDNATNRTVIKKMLELAGHDVVLAFGGEPAVDFLEQHTFDLVIVDMNMPDMTGIDVLRAYDALRPPGSRVPFVMLSADATETLRHECEAAGFGAYLTKPIQSSTLLATIDALTDGRGEYVRAEPGTDTSPIRQLVLNTHRLDVAPLEQLDRISQSPECAHALIDDFVLEADELISQIQTALLSHMPAEAKRLAHALKGSGLSVGAVELCAWCDRINKAPVRELDESSRDFLTEIRACFDDTRTLLAEYRESPNRRLSASNH